MLLSTSEESYAMNPLIPVVLSGGSGSRLWPLSRTLRPKQFLDVVGQGSLFQQTLMRLDGLAGQGGVRPLVVANQDHRFLVAEQCREAGVEPLSILLEHVARNTAPAIAVAAWAALEQAEDPLLLVLPSDHTFADVPAFERAVAAGKRAASEGRLVTFGIVPTHPETGYGYIKAAETLSVDAAAPVERFVEKPDLASAEAYLTDGGYTWNSGMFLFSARVFLSELQRLHPQMHEHSALAWSSAQKDLDFVRLDAAAFSACPSDSVDYAVMERTDRASVVPLDAGWSDVGAWSAVWEVQPQDADGNAVRGDAILSNTRNSYVHAETRLVALLGVDDLVVVETADAVLVTRKDQTQHVKQLVVHLKNAGRTEADQHRQVYRPWGSYDSVDQGERFQVKRIVVKPGAKLSVQMHHRRSEHWVVVSGTAAVRIDDAEQIVTENQSVYIPLGAVHSLENPGKVPLHLIEVQSGAYLGEDDIVRFEDRYGRVG